MTWERAWQEGRTRWDAGGSPPALLQLVAGSALPRGRALVPGCGSGYDVLTLANPEREVVGLEIARTAIARFEALRRNAGVSPEHARVVEVDFFEYTPEEPFDLLWDYTFFCALDPGLRPRWAERVDELLADDGELITLIFPVPDGEPRTDGPPYDVAVDDVRTLLASRFEPTELEPVPRSHRGREGREWLGRWRKASRVHSEAT